MWSLLISKAQNIYLRFHPKRPPQLQLKCYPERLLGYRLNDYLEFHLNCLKCKSLHHTDFKTISWIQLKQFQSSLQRHQPTSAPVATTATLPNITSTLSPEALRATQLMASPLPYPVPLLILYLNFLFWYSFYLHSLSTALTTPLNLGGCVTVH